MTKRLSLLAIGIGVAASVVPASAQACSCAVEENPKAQARAVLEYSDAAFIGELVSVRVDPGQTFGPAVFRYRVPHEMPIAVAMRWRFASREPNG